MRFASLLLPLALFSTTSIAKSQPKRQTFSIGKIKSKAAVARAPTSPNVSSLDKRQRPGELLGVTLCVELGADVDLDLGGLGLLGLDQLLGLGVNDDLCVCIAGGVLTDTSVAQVGTAVRNRGLVNLLALGFLNADAAVNAVLNALVVLLGAPGAFEDPCGYPANSIPTGCDNNCEFTCAEGFFRCGDLCLAPGLCPSGIPIPGNGRRSLVGAGANADLLCPRGLSACGIVAPGAGGKMLVRGKFECLDTASDVETCGGCIVPLLGRPKGTDCTAIPFVDEVSCIRGKCVVQSCEPGYIRIDTECIKMAVPAETDSQSLLGANLQLAADVGLGVLGL